MNHPWLTVYNGPDAPRDYQTPKDVYLVRSNGQVGQMCISCAVKSSAELSDITKDAPCQGCGTVQRRLL